MTASTSALTRELAMESRIHQVRKFGRSARFVCAALFGFGVVGLVLMLVIIMLINFGPGDRAATASRGDGGAYDILTSPLTPLAFKIWWLFITGVAISVWLAAVHQLYGLFGNLASGAIYTPENVRRVRNVGVLWLVWALLSFVLPLTLGVAHRLIAASVTFDVDRLLPAFGEIVSSFIGAGIVLLISWIMDLGLYEKEYAATLERDAELTI